MARAGRAPPGSVQIERTGRSLIVALVDLLKRLAELLFHQSVAVFETGLFAFEEFLRSRAALLLVPKEGLEALASFTRSFGLLMMNDLACSSVHDQFAFAVGAADSEVVGLAHEVILVPVGGDPGWLLAYA